MTRNFSSPFRIALSLPLLSAILCAQPPSPPTPPVQLTSAHSAFLGYGGSNTPGGLSHEAIANLYNSTWNALSGNSAYKFTTSASEADLLMELSVQYVVADVTNGNSFFISTLRLSIFDKKTHALLWTLDEGVTPTVRKKSGNEQLNGAINRLAVDLKQLSEGKLP